MAKLLGNDYRLWIESSTAGTFYEIKGNTALKINRTAELIDTSAKSDFPYGTQAPGLRNCTIDFTIIPDLPDTNGFGRLEARAAQSASTNFQIRKDGSSGTDPDDVVFEAAFYIGNFSTDMPKNAPVTVEGQLALAAAPTTDELA